MPGSGEAGNPADSRSRRMAYVCCSTPVELITAAGFTPYRLTGSPGRAPAHAGACLEKLMCPFLQSAFDAGLSGELGQSDGLVMGRTCDNITSAFSVFRDRWQPSFAHFIDIPHKTNASSRAYFKAEFTRFRQALGEAAGRPITDSDLRAAIGAHNRSRELQRRLGLTRRGESPPLPASAVQQALLRSLRMPVEEANRYLEGVLAPSAARLAPGGEPARVLVWGSHTDDPARLDAIESCGARIVADDLCLGYRTNQFDVRLTDDPMDGIVEAYSVGQLCPRMFRRARGASRFSHIRRMAREARVEGAILSVMRYCDPTGFEVPALSRFLQHAGIPLIVIEDDYSAGSSAQVRSRVQAFVELLVERRGL